MSLILGLFHLANGLWMLTAPHGWYMIVPGVSTTGPLNHHFISDVALAFVASGAGFIWRARPGSAAYTIAGAAWPALHALLHIWGWIAGGFPTTAPVALSEAVGVVGIGLLGAIVASLRAKQEGMV